MYSQNNENQDIATMLPWDIQTPFCYGDIKFWEMWRVIS